ncbi:MAG: hypothetical protein U0R17_01820 [Acidimicrobiia bacterium]
MTEQNSEQQKTEIAPIAFDDIEMQLVKDMAKRCWIIVIPALIGASIYNGSKGALAIVLATAIIFLNLLIAAQVAKVAARISPTAIMAGALGGFALRLVIVFVAALIVKKLEFVDFKLWLLSVAIGHITLLTWETSKVSFSLANNKQ